MSRRLLPLDLIDLERIRDLARLFSLCILVGVVAGLGAIAFYYLLEAGYHFFLDAIAGYRPPRPLGETPLFAETARAFSQWVLALLPPLGGLVSGLIVYSLAPEAEGHGTDAAIHAYHFRDGAIRARVPFVKTIASAITIGTGGSAGREGPIAQIGAGFGSILGLWLKLAPRERRILMAAGMGAGVGAIFRAPLAGALFASEVLYSEMEIEYEVIAPAILSSIVAYSTFALVFGWTPLFTTPEVSFRHPAELLAYMVLAVVIAVGARLYITVFYGVRNLFRRISIPAALKPALGGVLVGGISFVLPQALGTGFGVLQGAINGQLPAAVLLAVAGGKILTTAFTVGSGGSGGVFGPAVVIGGSLGGAVGRFFHRRVSWVTVPPGSFALVGMAGFFAAAANTPISTLIMVSEMTGNYQLLVPSMMVSLLGFLLVRRHTIYEKQVPTRADSPSHARDLMWLALGRLRVADALALREPRMVRPIPASASLHEVNTHLSNGACCVPVIDIEGKVTGEVTLEGVRALLGQQDSAIPVVAGDLAIPAAVTSPDRPLYEALRQMVELKRNELLILDGNDGQRMVDVLTSSDVNALFEQVGRGRGSTLPPFGRRVFSTWLRALRDRHRRDSEGPEL
jgi:chloride channel protein, CIC family